MVVGATAVAPLGAGLGMAVVLLVAPAAPLAAGERTMDLAAAKGVEAMGRAVPAAGAPTGADMVRQALPVVLNILSCISSGQQMPCPCLVCMSSSFYRL